MKIAKLHTLLVRMQFEGAFFETKKSKIDVNTPKCPKDTFRLLGFAFEASDEFAGFSHITVSYIEDEDTRYDAKCLMKTKDFLFMLEIDDDSENIFS